MIPLRPHRPGPARLVFLVLFAAILPVSAQPAGPGDTRFAQGVALYEAGDFEAALPILEAAAAREPSNSMYQLWLGRCYGRIAQRSNWVRAYLLARKTREQFERAVALDGENVAALRDLMQYYREAPGFLGGSAEKADAIARRLRTLEGTRDGPQDAPTGQSGADD